VAFRASPRPESDDFEGCPPGRETVGRVGQDFVKPIAEDRKRRTDFSPLTFGTKDGAKYAALTRPDLDESLMCFKLNNQIAWRKSVAHGAMPLEHSDFVNIFNRTRNYKLV
jgi:hypothetical protein